MLQQLLGAWLALTPNAPPAPPTTNVIPFRTEAQPRVDPVFGDAAALRLSVDRFFSLQTDMDRVRDEFSTAVHETLAALAGPAGAPAPKACPVATAAPYARALAAGGQYLLLCQELQGRYRDIRRADELGDAAALTPDYRAKIKKARELHQHLLDDYREMRVAFYDQLGAEMRHVSCKLGTATAIKTDRDRPDEKKTGRRGADTIAPNPTGTRAPGRSPTRPPPSTRRARPCPLPVAARPAARARRDRGRDARARPGGPLAFEIWTDVDNTLWPLPTRVSVDGQPLGEVGARKKTSVRTHAGPRELCALPASDVRACGDPGTVRKAYLHEGGPSPPLRELVALSRRARRLSMLQYSASSPCPTARTRRAVWTPPSAAGRVRDLSNGPTSACEVTARHR